MELTYLGYGLLFLGLILTLFDSKSRIRYLMREINKMPIASIILFLGIGFVHQSVYAQHDNYSEYITTYLEEHRANSLELANEFGKVIVQRTYR